MIIFIQKYLQQNNILWKLIDDPEFQNVRTILDNVMKERVLNNVRLVRKKAELITLEHEEHLWKTETLGKDTPDKLRDSFVHLRNKLGIKSRRVYREDTVTKTNDGGLSNLQKEHKVVWIFPSENVLHRLVRLVNKYVSLCPPVWKNKKFEKP